MTVVDRSMYGQQLNRGHAELDQVVDHRRRGEPGEGAALHGIDSRMLDRDPTNMQLEDDRFFPGDLRTTILAPSEGGLDDPAFWDLARIVAAVERQIGPLTAYAVAKQRIAPPQPAVQRLGIGIDQQLVGIKAVPIRRIVWSVDTVAVK